MSWVDIFKGLGVLIALFVGGMVVMQTPQVARLIQPSYQDCESDMSCFITAFLYGCQNTTYVFNFPKTSDGGGGSIQKIITNIGTYCEYQHIMRNFDGRRIETDAYTFPIPIRKCIRESSWLGGATTNETYGYNDTEGKCQSISNII
ncbi:hypothetical protein COS70_03965 [Candidatus Micrarchaeota archaeon CG06_land_8_20_14_3_00_50_6]|nr:MAG: hypothetical protein COS70_03965 [Candidatus Micrarchaeota archaeon CG06_land_8_20_14_3_00_50_6]